MRGVRVLNTNNLTHLDLLGVAVLIMTNGYRIQMQARKSALASRRRIMPGYVDGLVLDFVSMYTAEERSLLMARLLELGIPTDTTFTMRRTSKRNLPEILIPERTWLRFLCY